MIRSVRRYLFFNLMIFTALIATFTVFTTVYLNQKELNKYKDAQLRQTAFVIESLLDISQQEHNTVWLRERLSQLWEVYDELDTETTPEQLDDLPKFAVFDAHKQRVFTSDPRSSLQLSLSSDTLLSAPDGYSTVKAAEGTSWRLYARTEKKARLRIITADPHGIKTALTHKVLQQAGLTLLLSYPLLALLIWLIVGRGLADLYNLTFEVQQRAPEHLNPLPYHDFPKEIMSIVHAWNSLLTRLKHAFEREKRFTADAAHEMKTPLAGLRTHAQLAINAANESERLVALNRVIASVDRSTHIIQQLLTLSRIGYGAAENKLTTIDLSQEVKQVISDLIHDALKKDQEIELLPIHQPVIVLGYDTSLSILVRNLIDNAIRYTPEGGTIQIELEAFKQQIFLRVIDDGPGIPELLHERVFERFYRVLGNKSPGSGLGLGIVKQIAELHQATVHLSVPKSGKGLQVTIVFPSVRVFLAAKRLRGETLKNNTTLNDEQS